MESRWNQKAVENTWTFLLEGKQIFVIRWKKIALGESWKT